MLKELKDQAREMIMQNINDYEQSIAELEGKLVAIDEEYRKKAEEAKKTIAEEVAGYKKMVGFWKDAASRMDAEEEETATTEETPAVEEEKVVDTLYPENNEVVSEPEGEVVESGPSEVAVEDITEVAQEPIQTVDETEGFAPVSDTPGIEDWPEQPEW